MAYPNQIKCTKCGKSIPSMPEDSSPEELLCDRCHDINEHAETIMNDGKLRDFFRGELGVIGCDDDRAWVLIATELIKQISDGIATVTDKSNKE